MFQKMQFSKYFQNVPEQAQSLILVDLLDGWASTAGSSSAWSSSCTWHASSHTSHVRHSSWHTTCSLVQLGDDGVANTLHLLLLVVELLNLGQLIGIQPLDSFITLVSDGLHIILGDLVLDLVILKSGLHVEAVALQPILGRNPVLLLVILCLELLGIIHHPLNLLLGQAALVISDGDLVLLASALVSGRHVQDTVSIDVKGDLNLGNSPGCRRDSGQIELAEVVVVLRHGPLALVDLDSNGGLVVGIGGEGLGLLGWDGGVPLNQGGHYATSGLNSKRERCNVEEEKVRDGLRSVAGQNGSLDGSTIGHGLVGVDRLVQVLPVEEVLQKLLDLGDPGGATNEDNVVDGRFVHLGVPHCLLNGLKGALEEVRAQLLKPGPGDGGVEVDALEQGVDLNVGLGGGRKGPLGPLAGSPQPPQGALVALHVLLVLPLELVDKVVDHAVVKVFSTEMGVTSGGLHLEDALFDGQDGDVEGAATKIEDQDVAFGRALLFVQAVGDGSSCRLVDDPENIEAADDSSILGRLPLAVVEVGWNCHDGVLDVVAQVSLSRLLHLRQHHGTDLLRGEGLCLVLVLDLQLWLVPECSHFEWPVLHVRLDGGVLELASDQPLCVEDGVGWVDGDLVLGGVPDEPLGVGEGNI